MKVKITMIAEYDFDNLKSDMSFDAKNYVVLNKMDKLLECGGVNLTQMWWEEKK